MHFYRLNEYVEEFLCPLKIYVMDKNDLKQKVEELNKMILEGKFLEAFDKFYAPEVRMQDNDLPIRDGFEANRKFEEAFLSNIMEFRNAKLLNTIISDGVVANEWHFDFSHKEWGVRNYSQIGIQRWKNGKIIEEKFYYNN
jgi:hypothetical protein